MKYEIIATGSKGNAVLINDILVDCGIPFKKLKPYLYDVNTLLITHEHSDHVKATTLRAIKKHFPNIQVVANYMIKQLFPEYVDLTANGGVPLFTQSGIVTPFDCVHDVPCLGYSWIVDGKKVVYATDTSTMENCPVDIAVDYCFLEANYDEIKVQQIVQNTDMLKKYGYDIRKGTVRHFSKQQCKSFFYKNRADENSVLVQLHQSARFY